MLSSVASIRQHYLKNNIVQNLYVLFVKFGKLYHTFHSLVCRFRLTMVPVSAAPIAHGRFALNIRAMLHSFSEHLGTLSANVLIGGGNFAT